MLCRTIPPVCSALVAAVVAGLAAPLAASPITVTYQQGFSGYNHSGAGIRDGTGIDRNYGANEGTVVGWTSGGTTLRGIFDWSLPGIPAGVQITDVSIAYNKANDAISVNANATLTLHTLTSAFTEGTQIDAPGLVNWTQRTASNNWTTAGGDFLPGVLASVNANPTNFDPFSFTGSGAANPLVQAVQDAVDNSTSFRYLMKSAETLDSTRVVFQLRSDDYLFNTSLRPKLSVTYIIPEPATLALAGLGGLLLLPRRTGRSAGGRRRRVGPRCNGRRRCRGVWNSVRVRGGSVLWQGSNMKRSRTCLAGVVVGAAAASDLWGAGILVNPSFESGGSGNASDNSVLRGWQHLQWSGTSNSARTGKDGSNYYFQWGGHTVLTSAALRPNAVEGQQFSLSFLWGIESGTTLWDDSRVFLDFYGASGLISSAQYNLTRTPADSVLRPFSTSAVAPAGSQTVGVRLATGSIGGNAINFDNVVLRRVTPVGAVHYDFGAVGAHTLDPTVAGTHMTATAITRGTGLSGNSGGGNALVTTSEFTGSLADAGVDRPGLFVRSSGTAATVADAVTQGDYLSFEVTPDTGYALSLTALNFDSLLQNGTTATTLSSTIELRSSLDGFVGTLGQVTRSITAYGSGDPTAVTPWNWNSFALGPAFAQVAGPVEFRLYFADNLDVDSTVVRLDNVAVIGDAVVIPEPAALGVIVCGGLLVLRRGIRA